MKAPSRELLDRTVAEGTGGTRTVRRARRGSRRRRRGSRWNRGGKGRLSNLPLQKLFLRGLKKKIKSGGNGIRTHDPSVANAVLSQLSYAPTLRS